MAEPPLGQAVGKEAEMVERKCVDEEQERKQIVFGSTECTEHAGCECLCRKLENEQR